MTVQIVDSTLRGIASNAQDNRSWVTCSSKTAYESFINRQLVTIYHTHYNWQKDKRSECLGRLQQYSRKLSHTHLLYEPDLDESQLELIAVNLGKSVGDSVPSSLLIVCSSAISRCGGKQESSEFVCHKSYERQMLRVEKKLRIEMRRNVLQRDQQD